MGVEGKTGDSLDTEDSRDDIIRTDNGAYMGLARTYGLGISLNDS